LYELVVEQDSLTIRALRDLAETVHSFGFSSRNQETSEQHLFSALGDELIFGTEEGALTWMAGSDGLLEWWFPRLGLDVGLHVTRDRSKSFWDVAAQRYVPPPTGLATIGLSVNRVFLRPSRHRRAIWTTIYRLYGALAEGVGAGYGYALDEDHIELVLPQLPENEEAALGGAAPKLLFWLNYFPSALAREIDWNGLRRLGATQGQLPGGVLVSFARYPWRFSPTMFVRLNERWRDTRMGSRPRPPTAG
jgi:hypothetical protein